MICSHIFTESGSGKVKEAKLAFERALHYNPWLGPVASKLVQIEKLHTTLNGEGSKKRQIIDKENSKLQGTVSRSKSGGTLTII